MEKLYGFRESDVISICNLIKEKKGGSLTSIFNRYALITGKSKGTIRNLYYTITKASVTDRDFCDRYLDGKPLFVDERVGFYPCQERALLKQILLKKNQGVSVRKAVKELALGDEKLALRYQNKFRGLIKGNKSLVLEVIEEIKKTDKDFSVNLYSEKQANFNKVQVVRLKKEINSLFERTFIELKKENQQLKQENNRLKSLLFLENKSTMKDFFDSEDKKDLLC